MRANLKDMDRRSTGSATNSSPPAVRWLGFLLRLLFGWKHETAGTMQLGRMHEEAVNGDGLVEVGADGVILPETSWTAGEVSPSDFKERSKSVSMMWPSDRTSTFSGFRSRYTTPSMWMYSMATTTSEA